MLFTAITSQEEIWAIVNKELQLASKEVQHPFRFVNFCTSAGNQPDSRYVVLREVTEELQLLFYTDSRSKKIAQIRENPNVSLLFYHPSARCQVKIKGIATILAQKEANEGYWENIPPEAQKAYQSKWPPKTEVETSEKGMMLDVKYNNDYFSVIKVVTYELECLQLDSKGHLRIAFKKENEKWQSSWLVP
ncbi:pyridoxamine 5'-phosphate oxidase family protein [uncultured Cyclobacterium sp.]|uniref:pyridoxamine 5'-phosphate oxidase family protein n=1 Tax=uncultured Cyclobacterium sp. TaxID=453820 RepID=UPI0030EC4B83